MFVGRHCLLATPTRHCPHRRRRRQHQSYCPFCTLPRNRLGPLLHYYPLSLSLSLFLLMHSSGATRAGVTRGGNRGCHTHFFPGKKLTPFYQFCSVTPIYCLLKNLFCSSLSLLLVSLGCHFPEWCHPTPFLPVRLRLSTLCKFTHIFSFGCQPLEGVTRGGPPI